MSYDHPYQNPQAPPPYSPYSTGEPKPTAPQFNEYGSPFVPQQPGYPPQQGYVGQMPYATQQGAFQTQPIYPPTAPPPQGIYQQQAAGTYYPQQPYGQGYVQPQPTGWYGQGQPQGTTTYVVEENRRNQSNRLADCCLVACCTMLFCELCRICND